MDWNLIVLTTMLFLFFLGGITLVLFARKIEYWGAKRYTQWKSKLLEEKSMWESYYPKPLKPAFGVWGLRVLGTFFAVISLYLLPRLL